MSVQETHSWGWSACAAAGIARDGRAESDYAIVPEQATRAPGDTSRPITDMSAARLVRMLARDLRRARRPTTSASGAPS